MVYRNFIIHYSAKNKHCEVIKSGIMRAKKKMSSFEAQVTFEEHLKRSLPGFHSLVVHKCYEESPFDSIFGTSDFPFSGL